VSLSQFSFAAKAIQEMQSWFIDIMNHLSAKNYNNGSWTPVITGMDGVPGGGAIPVVQAWFQRFGIECSFTVIINGTHTMNDGATMSLPVSPTGSGVIIMHSLTSNSTIGTACIDIASSTAKIPNYFVTDEVVIIRGFYKVSGI
jgi:hypothetical protein